MTRDDVDIAYNGQLTWITRAHALCLWCHSCLWNLMSSLGACLFQCKLWMPKHKLRVLNKQHITTMWVALIRKENMETMTDVCQTFKHCFADFHTFKVNTYAYALKSSCTFGTEASFFSGCLMAWRISQYFQILCWREGSCSTGSLFYSRMPFSILDYYCIEVMHLLTHRLLYWRDAAFDTVDYCIGTMNPSKCQIIVYERCIC